MLELARPRVELGEQADDSLVRAQVEPRGLADGRLLEPVRVAQHRDRQRAHGRDGVGLGAERVEGGNRRTLAQPRHLLLDPLGCVDGAPAEPSLDEVDARARQPRVRAAQVREQLAPAAAGPREAQEREERLRLYYVAMTRAIDRLIVSGAIDPGRGGDGVPLAV